MFLLQRAEEDAHAFLDKELKKLWRGLFPDYPQCSETQREEDEEVVDGEEEEQRRRAIEGSARHHSALPEAVEAGGAGRLSAEAVRKNIFLFSQSYFYCRLNDIMGDIRFPSNFRLKSVHTFGSDGGVADNLLIDYVKIVEDYFIQQANSKETSWSRSR